MDQIFENKPLDLKEPISREILAKRLHSVFKDMSLRDFAHLFINEFTAVMEYGELAMGADTCQKLSLLFNPHRLDIATLSRPESIYQLIKDENFCSGLARAILFRQTAKKGSLLYDTIGMGVNGSQVAFEFPPHVARNLCQEYHLDKKSRVLDPCAGWGGRMIGVSTVCNHYHCFEPSTLTYRGLVELYFFIRDMDDEFRLGIQNLPFEDYSLVDEYYDFALTSPPYYDTEVYSNEETNSLNRYKSFDDWCKGFYLPLIQKTMNALKPGSVFIFNIGSRKYPLSTVLVDNFGKKYQINKKDNFYLSGNGAFGRTTEGESFYEIKKV